MTLTDRDRKIMIGIVPLALVAAIWLLVLAPKRSEATKVQDQLTSAEQRSDAAEAKAGSVESAKTDYAKDYETVVRLGKAIPSSIDMPSLIVQLSKASKGAHISFTKVTTGDGTSSPASGSSAPGAPSSSTSSSTPAASSGSGGSSSGSASSSGSGSTSNTGSGASPTDSGSSNSSGSTDSTTSSSSPGSSSPSTGSGSSGAPGLDTVPLTFGFDGSFFDLADFFHQMKRFVRVASQDRLKVGGRLMTIDGFSLDSTEFPRIKAEVSSTVYLAPKSQGATAGATSDGPSPSTEAPSASNQSTGTSAPTPSSSSGTPR